MITRRPYTTSEIAMIKRLRMTHMPAEIAEIVNRTKGAIDRILSVEKRDGESYPKLKHGNRKYGLKHAQRWREMVKTGKKYRMISEIENVYPVAISRVLCAEIRGELSW